MGRAFEVRKAAMAKTSLNKAKIYSKYGKEIYIAAKSGTTDPESNLVLRKVIEKAKKEEVPGDIIKRAIDKAKSGLNDNYQPVIYEGFGPGASLLIISCLTDNINRTISDIRTAFNKSKAKLGNNGSVSFQFSHNAIFTLSGVSEEEVIFTLIENNIEVEKSEIEDGYLTIYFSPSDYQIAEDTISKNLKNAKFEEEVIEYVPHETITLEGEEKDLFNRLISHLEQSEDIQDIFHNVSGIN